MRPLASIGVVMALFALVLSCCVEVAYPVPLLPTPTESATDAQLPTVTETLQPDTPTVTQVTPETHPTSTPTITPVPSATPTETMPAPPPTPTPIGKFPFGVITPHTPQSAPEGVYHAWYGTFIPDETIWLRKGPSLEDEHALISGSTYWDSLRPGENYAVYCVYVMGGWWWGSSDLCPTNTRPSGLWFCMFNPVDAEWYGEFVKGELP